MSFLPLKIFMIIIFFRRFFLFFLLLKLSDYHSKVEKLMLKMIFRAKILNDLGRIAGMKTNTIINDVKSVQLGTNVFLGVDIVSVFRISIEF